MKTHQTIITIILIVIVSLNNYGQIINGRVCDKQNKVTLPFASIGIYKNEILIYEANTDIDGKFQFKNVGLGDFKLITKYIGCKPDTTLLKLISDKEYVINLTLFCEGIICIETVVDSSVIDFKFVNISVTDFLKYLRLDTKSPIERKILLISGHSKTNWITLNDIHYLMPLIASKEKAKCVWTEVSSIHRHYDNSTIGGQVMNLIDSYRLNKQYPFFLQDCSTTDTSRIAEITEWWKQLKK